MSRINFETLVSGAALLGLAGLAGYASYTDAEEAKKYREAYTSEYNKIVSNARNRVKRLSCEFEATSILDDAEKAYLSAGGSTIRDAYANLKEVASLIHTEKESELLRMYYEKKLAKAEEESRKMSSSVGSADDPVGITFRTSWDAEEYLKDLGYKEYGSTYIKGASCVKIVLGSCEVTIVSAR